MSTEESMAVRSAPLLLPLRGDGVRGAVAHQHRVLSLVGKESQEDGVLLPVKADTSHIHTFISSHFRQCLNLSFTQLFFILFIVTFYLEEHPESRLVPVLGCKRLFSYQTLSFKNTQSTDVGDSFH